MYLIDTHSHISHFPLQEQDGVIERARAAGVKKMINVACDLDQVDPHTSLANKHDDIWSSAGIHPTSLNDDLEGSMKQIRESAEKEPKIIAIGEIGLDYYHDKHPHDMQDKWFTAQLDIARDLGLPAIIHCRGGKNPGENAKAFKDLGDILEREKFSDAVIHCFSGDEAEAQRMLDMGCNISFTGIITYKSNHKLRDVVKMVPLDRIILETDCPYLTIEGKRGQPGEPAFMTEIIKTVADVKDITVEEAMEQIRLNTEGFFGI